MDNETPLTLIDAVRARDAARRLFEAVSKSLGAMLPPRVDIRHIGATAVPGCLTKGDLDIVVRAPVEDFETADGMLASRYSRNDGSVRTATFSAFEDPSSHPHLGIQLVTIDGPLDDFHLFVEALQGSSQLIQEYNTLKRLHEGADMERYRAAKDAFVERVLASVRSRK